MVHAFLTVLNFFVVKMTYYVTEDLTAWELTFARSLMCLLIMGAYMNRDANQILTSVTRE